MNSDTFLIHVARAREANELSAEIASHPTTSRETLVELVKVQSNIVEELLAAISHIYEVS